jgi:hypothetical protein
LKSESKPNEILRKLNRIERNRNFKKVKEVGRRKTEDGRRKRDLFYLLFIAIDFLFHTFALSQRGALKKRAEIIPNEPGTGNAV